MPIKREAKASPAYFLYTIPDKELRELLGVPEDEIIISMTTYGDPNNTVFTSVRGDDDYA